MRRLTLRLGEAQAGRTVHTLLRQELLLSAASVRRAKTLPDGILLYGQPGSPTKQDGRDSFSRWRWGTWRGANRFRRFLVP